MRPFQASATNSVIGTRLTFVVPLFDEKLAPRGVSSAVVNRPEHSVRVLDITQLERFKLDFHTANDFEQFWEIEANQAERNSRRKNAEEGVQSFMSRVTKYVRIQNAYHFVPPVSELFEVLVFTRINNVIQNGDVGFLLARQSMNLSALSRVSPPLSQRLD